MDDDKDPVVESIASVATALVRRDSQAARHQLESVDCDALRTARSLRIQEVSRRTKGVVKPVVVGSRGAVRRAVQQRVFERCSYTCVYCARQTIDLRVLKQISRIVPDAFPYHPAWRFDSAHVVYWTHSTSLEHVQAIRWGGTDDEANLVAACYGCNDARGDAPLDRIGWKVHVVTSDWRGLTELLPDLRRVPAASARSGVTPVVRKPTTDHATRRQGSSDSSTTYAQDDVVAAPPPEHSLIRARLPQKKTRRQYRVEAVEGWMITLREMWREGGSWRSSRTRRECNLHELADVEIVEPRAPTEG